MSLVSGLVAFGVTAGSASAFYYWQHLSFGTCCVGFGHGCMVGSFCGCCQAANTTQSWQYCTSCTPLCASAAGLLMV